MGHSHRTGARAVRPLLALAAVVAVLGGAVVAGAADKKGHEHGKSDKKDVKTTPVTGKVIDIACYILEGGVGPEHKACATGGVPVGLLDKDGNIWVAINDKYGSAHDLLVPHMGETVRTEGWHARRGAYRLISISSVEVVAKAAAKEADKAGKKAEVWECPHRCATSDKPGKCPKCGMEMKKKG